MYTKTTTVTFRTLPSIKVQAEKLFNSLGMTLSAAIDMFLHEAILENKYPCSLDSSIVKNRISDMSMTYPQGFFDMYGAIPELELHDNDDLSYSDDCEREPL